MSRDKLDVDEGGSARRRIRDFVAASLGNQDLADDDDIFSIGGATSLFSMQLVIFIEEDLGVPLDDDDLTRDNFSTIASMANMIERKHGA